MNLSKKNRAGIPNFCRLNKNQTTVDSVSRIHLEYKTGSEIGHLTRTAILGYQIKPVR